MTMGRKKTFPVSEHTQSLHLVTPHLCMQDTNHRPFRECRSTKGETLGNSSSRVGIVMNQGEPIIVYFAVRSQ